MPIKLKVRFDMNGEKSVKFTGVTPDRESVEVELPVTKLDVEVAPGIYPLATVQFLVSELEIDADAIKLAELAGIGWALYCFRCKEKMVRAHYQNEEGDWFVCHLCGCEPEVPREPDPEVVDDLGS